MPSLAEFQQQMRDAVVGGDFSRVAPLLTAGAGNAARRADIHRRHYQTSLVTAVMGRFPATAWLIGSPTVEVAAIGFVRAHPPAAPCIAEYGRGFPAWLSGQIEAGRVPFVEAFAALDWQLGRLAVSADSPALDPVSVASLAPDVLADAVLDLQEGTHYAKSDWPIDTLMQAFLGEPGGDYPAVVPQPVWLEARGSRGVVSIGRLSEAEWEFRSALQQARPIGVAAERAWQFDSQFDPGIALANLFTVALVSGSRSLEGRDS